MTAITSTVPGEIFFRGRGNGQYDKMTYLQCVGEQHYNATVYLQISYMDSMNSA